MLVRFTNLRIISSGNFILCKDTKDDELCNRVISGRQNAPKLTCKTRDLLGGDQTKPFFCPPPGGHLLNIICPLDFLFRIGNSQISFLFGFFPLWWIYCYLDNLFGYHERSIRNSNKLNRSQFFPQRVIFQRVDVLRSSCQLES